jgi:hypothetical protein
MRRPIEHACMGTKNLNDVNQKFCRIDLTIGNSSI